MRMYSKNFLKYVRIGVLVVVVAIVVVVVVVAGCCCCRYYCCYLLMIMRWKGTRSHTLGCILSRNVLAHELSRTLAIHRNLVCWQKEE